MVLLTCIILLLHCEELHNHQNLIDNSVAFVILSGNFNHGLSIIMFTEDFMKESNRLVYRKLNKTDFKLFSELYSDIRVMQYAYADYLKSEGEALNAFKDTLNKQTKQLCTEYVATCKVTNQPIGIVDYDVILRHENGGIYEIGYFIKPEYWGKGFAFEMAAAIVNHAFLDSNIHKIIASCNTNHKKSEHVMKKLGMKKEGILRKVRYKNNQWEDEIKYGLLKDEWDVIQNLGELPDICLVD